MNERIRVTGDNPPIELMEKHPNWENCWDEEDADDQDETTLRPSRNQTRIHEEVAFTAGEVTYSDGRTYPAILAGLEGDIEDVWVYSFGDSRKCWGVSGSMGESAWEAFAEDDLIEAAPIDDSALLPLTVRSRLPLKSSGKPIEIRIAEISGTC